MIPVEDDEQSAYQAARAALTARYGHLVLKFTPAYLLALVRAAMGDRCGEGHLWVTEDINRDPADSSNVLISQRLACVDCPERERVITVYHPQPAPAEARE